MDQEYPISFHDLVPYKGPGKLKQTPENLVNKSQDWWEIFNLGVLVKVINKFLKVRQYSKRHAKKNTLAHWETHTTTLQILQEGCYRPRDM